MDNRIYPLGTLLRGQNGVLLLSFFSFPFDVLLWERGVQFALWVFYLLCSLMWEFCFLYLASRDMWAG